MKKSFLLVPLFLLAPFSAAAEDEMIDPPTYICAELVASSVDGKPPIYEALQLDGFNAAKTGQATADAMTLSPVLFEVFDSCSAMPTDKALEHWKKARNNTPADTESPWRADKTTCADYYANTDDGSGFIIWLDAYNRSKTGKGASVLKDQATINAFLEKCKANPKRLVLDVLNENAK